MSISPNNYAFIVPLQEELRFLLRDECDFHLEVVASPEHYDLKAILTTFKARVERRINPREIALSQDPHYLMRLLARGMVDDYHAAVGTVAPPPPWEAAKVGNFLEAYSAFTRTTASNPGALTGLQENLCYLVLGLASEAGEVAGKYKKVIRGDKPAPTRQDVLKELGDVMWYAARLAEDLGSSLEEVMAGNWKKLASRKEAGTIKGSGDER